MSKRTKYLLLACLVPVFILLGMTVKPLYTIYNGEEILLQTIPVDPSDPFRGDYVSLRFEVEEVPLNLVDQEILDKRDTMYNAQVYVSLGKEGSVYSPTKVSLHKPSKGIFLKGNLQYFDKSWNPVSQKEAVEVAFINYSIDKYFVEDNTGLEWEQASTRGDIVAKVKVFNGYAYLTDIMMED
ncbi:GDYXXLXY domain-containing protein [Neobacillus sp. LXY-4]|uniref:GDYXXLXY domain-containing protein n=1 Tax=Neobacillus sp. LXY-4 TaxID=3379826 RepID=UPI003EDE9A00